MPELTCRNSFQLQAFLDQTLDAPEADQLENHVDQCRVCQAILDRLTMAASRIRERREALSSVVVHGLPHQPSTGPDVPADTQLIEGRPLLAPYQLVLKPDVPGFRIDGEIGRGGMGVVYRGMHKRLNRPVAIKMVLAGGLADPRVTQRFLFEAEVLARVAHPQVVQIYEAGVYQAPGGVAVPYLAMELLDGGTLYEVTRGPRLNAIDAAALVADLAHAAHAAHMQGVVHRDIKPANILRAPDGPFKLADFGLAKLTASAGEGLTGTGTVVGTPSYMAPEQARGLADIGPAADIYSLGAILYELLTGRPPFAGGEPMSLLMKVIHQTPAEVRSLAPSVPRDLAAVAMKCLSKDIPSRYATAEALADDLDRVGAGMPTIARPLRRREKVVLWCRRNPTVAGLLVLLGATVAGALAGTTMLYLQAQREAGNARASATLAAGNEQAALAERAAADRANAYLEFEQGAAWCEQGRPDHGMALFLQALERSERVGDAELSRVIRVNVRNWSDALFPAGREVSLAHGAVCRVASYSPDGKQMALGSDGDCIVRLFDADTGARLAELSPPRPSLANGLLGAVTVGTEGLQFAGPDWGSRFYRAIDHIVDHFLGRGCMTISFDTSGSWVATGHYDGRVTAWELPSGKSVRVVLPGSPNVWSVVANRAGGFWVAHERGIQSWNPATGRRGPIMSTDAKVGPRKLSSVPVNKLLASPDGQWLFSGDRAGQVIQWDTKTARPVAAWQVPGWVIDLTPAPLSPAPHLFVLSTTGSAYQLEAPAAPEALGTSQEIFDLNEARGKALALYSDSRVLAVGDGDGNVALVDTFTGRDFTSPLHVPGTLREINFRPWSREFMIVSGAGVRVQTLPWPPAVPLSLPGSAVVAIDARACPDGNRVLAAAGGTATIFDPQSGQPQASRTEKTGLTAAALHPNNNWVLQGFRGQWGITDVARKRPVVTHAIPSYLSVRAFAVHPTTGELYVNLGTEVRVYAPDGTGSTRRSIPFSQFRVGEIANATLFTPDGQTLVVAHSDRIDFLDPLTGERLRPGLQADDEILAAALSSDGRTLATGHRDNTAQVWEVATGKPILASPLNHTRAVASIALSPDGQVVLTGCRDGTSQVFDVATRLPLGPTRQYRSPVTAVAWGTTADTFLTGAADGEACVWPLATLPAEGTVAELRHKYAGLTNNSLKAPPPLAAK